MQASVCFLARAGKAWHHRCRSPQCGRASASFRCGQLLSLQLRCAEIAYFRIQQTLSESRVAKKRFHSARGRSEFEQIAQQLRQARSWIPPASWCARSPKWLSASVCVCYPRKLADATLKHPFTFGCGCALGTSALQVTKKPFLRNCESHDVADATGKETVEQGHTSLNEGFRARVPATRQERACAVQGGRLRREVNPGVERIDIAVAARRRSWQDGPSVAQTTSSGWKESNPR